MTGPGWRAITVERARLDGSPSGDGRSSSRVRPGIGSSQRSVGISLISAISEKSRSVSPPTSWVDISIRTVR